MTAGQKERKQNDILLYVLYPLEKKATYHQDITIGAPSNRTQLRNRGIRWDYHAIQKSRPFPVLKTGYASSVKEMPPR